MEVARAVKVNRRNGKVWLYVICPDDIDYGSEAEPVALSFCPECGQKVEMEIVQ